MSVDTLGQDRQTLRRPGATCGAAAVALLLVLSSASAFAQATTTVTVAWDHNSDAHTVGYTLYYGTSPGSDQFLHDAGNQTTAQLTLTRGSIYYLRLRAYNSAGQVGPPSNEVSVNLVDTAPPPTAQITATLQNPPTTALVSWQTTNAVSATINGQAVGLSGSTTVPISATTTYTLIATNAAGATATHSATVTITAPPAPTAQITATLQNATTALITWSTTNATSATINGISVGLSGSTTQPISATTTYTLVARSASGATVTRSATVTVTPPAPTAQITATLQNATTASITWSTTNATTATINGIGVGLSGSTTQPISATTTYTLVARSASGATATQSATVTVTPPAPPPAPTAQLTASLQTPTTAALSWQTTNTVSATINGAAVPVSGSTTVPIASTTTYTLVATGASGTTATSSATVTVTPPPSPSPVPAAPTAMAAAVNGLMVTLTWRAPSTGAAPDGYLLDVGTAPGSFNLLNGYPVGNVLSVSGGLPRGRYYARVRAANAAGVSGYSNEVSFRTGRTLATPSGLAVQWRGSTAVMSWNAAAGDGSAQDQATAYILEAGTEPGTSNVATLTLGNVTSFQADVPGGTYYVRVRAVNDYGESEPTPDLTLAPPGAPGAPTGLTESGAGETVTLRWTAASDATDYILEAGTVAGGSNIGSLRIGNVTQFSTAAPPGTYYVRVRALNAMGVGPTSNEVVVRR